jgi:hypothetical protein
MNSILNNLHEEHKARQLRFKRAAIKIAVPTPPPLVVAVIEVPPEPVPVVTPKRNLINTFDIILYEVCAYYNVREIDILSSRRLGKITHPRHMLAYMLYRMTTFTTYQIGPRMNKDPSTIDYAIKKIRGQEEQHREAIIELERRIIDVLAQRKTMMA